jgi:hypothetical protein
MEREPRWEFSYTVPRQPDGTPSKLSMEEIDKQLIKQVVVVAIGKVTVFNPFSLNDWRGNELIPILLLNNWERRKLILMRL